MDHVDWMDEAYAKSLAATLAQQVAPGGKVIWRSAALTPPYAGIIAAAGFKVQCDLGTTVCMRRSTTLHLCL